jgi:TetR/AcrR family transcriptional regulator, repressor for uid operon
MNVHSHIMTAAQQNHPIPLPRAESRRQLILSAAQNVFTAKGFEGATMQDVAQACGMSPGNLYRYFGSKNALISGLVEADRQEMSARFAALSQAPDQLASFERLGRKYLKDEAKTAKFTLTIWAAALRSPELSLPCEAMECSASNNLKSFVDAAVESGQVAPGVDPELVVHLIMSLAQAFLRDAALVKDFDADRSLDIMFATVAAAMAGHIKVNSTQNEKVQVS